MAARRRSETPPARSVVSLRAPASDLNEVKPASPIMGTGESSGFVSRASFLILPMT
jgi:hypothetical protein